MKATTTAINDYIKKVNTHYKSGISREHAYRGDLEILIRALVQGIEVTNEPANVTDCGNPDYVITKNRIPIGYIEAKDLGKDLNSKIYKEQFSRYKNALDNLIITDYVWFQFFKEGQLANEIKIADVGHKGVAGLPENFSLFENLILEFCSFVGQTIKSPRKLAEMMASKARLLENILENAVNHDLNANNPSSLIDQYNTFKDILIHDLTPKGFADIYAQTLAYGMFAARLHDQTLDTFSRQEAAELIPKTNPFLRKLFGYVAGPDIDDRIRSVVENLAEVFRATNVELLLKNFGKNTHTRDPVIHFYETFLAEYDPKLRKSRGVWYTPEPVVKFIVGAVNDILKTEFGLSDGLADTSRTEIKMAVQGKKRPQKLKVHKVQILDPATGTGTFLAEVIRSIYQNKFTTMQGAWSTYVDEHLVPRLYGFEILMASYSMAHLKLDMLLSNTGYKPTKDRRFNIYLTNSLEEHHPDTGTLFSSWLSTEANEANHIKRDSPVMVVMGNPPYSGISINKGKWITDLIEDYKYVDGDHFNERKHWLNDDYVKFIRYGQHQIEKNGEGILAYINNHSFLDNPTFRGMRWHLLNTFDTIYILDLHGNSQKREVCPDGSPDKNVFDIQAGVSINLFLKTGKKGKGQLARVLHSELWGTRENKYDKLLKGKIENIAFKEVAFSKPYFFFKPKDETGRNEYEKGFKINDLFPNNVTGVLTMGDNFIVANSKKELKDRISDFLAVDYSEEELKIKYGLGKNYAKWIIANKQKIKAIPLKYIEIDYRPFDRRWTVFDNNLIWRWRHDTMKHFLSGDNIGLMTCRQAAVDTWNLVGITNLIADDSRVSNRSRERGYIFPLYLYPQATEQETLGIKVGRIPNLNRVLVGKISSGLNLKFADEKTETQAKTFTPEDLLNYIYATLHSPTYRKTYNEFLTIDFPRIPYPRKIKQFRDYVNLGSELREIHLLESQYLDNLITSYPMSGHNEVSRRVSSKDFELLDAKSGRVWINESQFFEGVPKIAWEMYLGGYQPAQKWLKDRFNCLLSYDDILHYQKIIVALSETDRLMKAIDKIKSD